MIQNVSNSKLREIQIFTNPLKFFLNFSFNCVTMVVEQISYLYILLRLEIAVFFSSLNIKVYGVGLIELSMYNYRSSLM